MENNSKIPDKTLDKAFELIEVLHQEIVELKKSNLSKDELIKLVQQLTKAEVVIELKERVTLLEENDVNHDVANRAFMRKDAFSEDLETRVEGLEILFKAFKDAIFLSKGLPDDISEFITDMHAGLYITESFANKAKELLEKYKNI